MTDKIANEIVFRLS